MTNVLTTPLDKNFEIVTVTKKPDVTEKLVTYIWDGGEKPRIKTEDDLPFPWVYSIEDMKLYLREGVEFELKLKDFKKAKKDGYTYDTEPAVSVPKKPKNWDKFSTKSLDKVEVVFVKGNFVYETDRIIEGEFENIDKNVNDTIKKIKPP